MMPKAETPRGFQPQYVNIYRSESAMVMTKMMQLEGIANYKIRKFQESFIIFLVEFQTFVIFSPFFQLVLSIH